MRGLVLEVLLGRRSSYSKQSVWLSARLSSCVMSSLSPRIQAHAALGLYFTCPLKNAWPAEAWPLASKQPSARPRRWRGRPRWSDPTSAFVEVEGRRCSSCEAEARAEDGGIKQGSSCSNSHAHWRVVNDRVSLDITRQRRRHIAPGGCRRRYKTLILGFRWGFSTVTSARAAHIT